MTTSSAVDAITPTGDGAGSIESRFDRVRSYSESIIEGLPVEDLVPQSMEDASPLKWHLAHTSWFFETFLLRESLPGYRPLRDEYAYLFNSYYNAVGPQYSRPQRGMITRPTVADVLEYRAYVNQHMARLFDTVMSEELEPAVVLGLNHEQQHQELMLTDAKHLFAQNPLLPEFRPGSGAPSGLDAAPLEWVGFAEGVYAVGNDGPAVSGGHASFIFDNEGPRHQTYLHAFELASRPVTNEEYLAFIDDGGYDRSTLWLSSGWATARSEGWRSPLYWDRRDGQWWQFTLGGERPLDLAAPVTHVSHYEADAYARWAGGRLPTEFEWEVAATASINEGPIGGNFADSGRWHPSAAGTGGGGLTQMYGDVWEWTSSAYLPYPGFYASDDAIGEYNGKFMSSQMVLRGGSVATPDAGHVRASYRNFFPPDARWQFSGIRLARDV